MGKLKSNLVAIGMMLHDIPEADLPEKPEDFWFAVAVELSTMMEYAAEAESPQIVLSDYRKAGSQNPQYLWEFWVNDLEKPKADEYNWHGQNTSQWKYAGAIVLQNRQVSRHH